MSSAFPEYAGWVSRYRNDAATNDALWHECQEATWQDPVLAAHRRHVEAHQLGFGDPAFHTLWKVLLTECHRRFDPPRLLEIGIFKGQVISLWSLLAAQAGYVIDIAALGPLTGQPMPPATLRNRILNRIVPRRRERLRNGDYYAEADYEGIVREHFRHHGQEFDRIRLFRGYSTDQTLRARLRDETFHLIYVDGDHTYEGSRHDFVTFAPKVVPGGWIVADDAGADLPGTAFWKGHPAVSRAARVLPELGFRNVFNIGHNCVYEKLPLRPGLR